MDILDKIGEGKIKGYLTINKRIIFEGAIYHITQRAPGKEILFVEEADYLYFLKILKETIKKFNLDLFCFSLLPNHLHLCLRIKEANLSEAMKNLFERYADYFNIKYKRKGHVFCGRFRASLCNDENYLLAISVYIHLNPYKAGLCRVPEDYRWGSLKLYTGAFKKTFVNFEEILSFLDPQLDKAKEKYSEILEESAKIKVDKLLDNSSVKKFIREVVRIEKKITGKREGEEEDLDKLIEDFKLMKKKKNLDRRARKYLVEQLLANGYAVKEILGLLSIGRTTFYQIMHSS